MPQSRPQCSVCPLCDASDGISLVHHKETGRYHVCAECYLVFRDPEDWLSEEEERRHYLTHENGPHHPGHVAFVSRLLDPLKAYLAPGMRGLDFGCGPVPTAPHLLAAQHVSCDIYDPFFAAYPLKPPYDFAIAVEVFEHLRYPGRVLDRITSVLAPQGLLGVMTERWHSVQQLTDWYYMRDPTHVAFYHSRTFDFICDRYHLVRCLDDGHRVVILRGQQGRAASY
jgi:SAM-dependent methyltransferase